MSATPRPSLGAPLLTDAALVVLDCDGVLVDTERLTVEVESRLLTELGWPLTQAEVVAQWMGRSSASQHAEVAERLGAEVAREFDQRMTRELHTSFERDLTAVEGVVAVLDALQAAGVPTCVASSGTHERIRRTLGLTGLWDRFAGRIFSATEVEHGKPAPDLFLLAAERMGAPPAGCVVVEDSPFGVRAGFAAGMRVIGFGGGLAVPGSLAEAGAEHVVETMAELGLLMSGATDAGVTR